MSGPDAAVLEVNQTTSRSRDRVAHIACRSSAIDEVGQEEYMAGIMGQRLGARLTRTSVIAVRRRPLPCLRHRLAEAHRVVNASRLEPMDPVPMAGLGPTRSRRCRSGPLRCIAADRLAVFTALGT